MNLLVSVDYATRWGESLRLCMGEKKYDMRYIYEGTWQVELEGVDLSGIRTYCFEVWKDGSLYRKEFRPHTLIYDPASKDTLVIHDRWQESPRNLPFYSSLFKDVVFRRPARKVSPASPKGNVTFSFLCPEVRSDMTVAITGSGKLFSDWKKMVPLDDSLFPLWSVTLEVKAPFEYKFVLVDRKTFEPVLWERGENHFFAQVQPAGTALIVADVVPTFDLLPWRGAGTAIPVFALRTEDSFGVGEFHDLRKLVDWAVATGQNVIQLLPINDTTMTGTWQDSYPYNANTTFALHPQFINLPMAGIRQDKKYKALKEELEALPVIDYERVNDAKGALLKEHFTAHCDKIVDSDEYKDFVSKNSSWLLPYAVFRCLRDEFGTPDFTKWGKWSKYSGKKVAAYCKDHPKEVAYHCWVQCCLDSQLHDAVQYAHGKGVALKGDLPIGISRTSVDAWANPELYHMDSQAGAPPDAFSAFGQNWGFPTYNWEKMAEDGFAWWKSRMRKMSEYFDAFRIDHILGFFRIWEIPMDAVHGLLGYFNPALPYSGDELLSKGFDMESGRYTVPPTDGEALQIFFGELSGEVASKYIKDGAPVPKVSSQRKAAAFFTGTDHNSKALLEGFLNLYDDVLFIEDPRKRGYYHPRISAQSSLSYQRLSPLQKQTFDDLYNDFFYHRHNEFWKASAMSKFPTLLTSTDMLTCGEDLGMIPACVPEVMDGMRILSLEIQRMSKDPKEEFADPSRYPYLSVCATGTHDTPTLRAWWEEDRGLTERFYHNMLGCGGEVPYFCEPWVCEKVISSHVKSPSMLCILPLADWLSIDPALRYQGDPKDERINVPAIPRYYWRYRMHLTVEALLKEHSFNSRMASMIREAGRNR